MVDRLHWTLPATLAPASCVLFPESGNTTIGVMYANDEAPGVRREDLADAQHLPIHRSAAVSRNIAEYNSFDRKINLNVLFTYRVNAGTVFYIGYDDRYQQADRIERDTNGDGLDDRFFFSTDLRRTNPAIFTKLQYLFRY